MCECLKIIGVCFLVNVLSLEKLDVLIFVVLLTKPDDPIFQTGLSDFDRLSIRFSKFFFVLIILSCASCNACSHTQNCYTYRMHR
jgi:hypothetical protein